MTQFKRLPICAVIAALSLAMLPHTQAVAQASAPTVATAPVTASPEEARAIAKDAYLYAYPMLFNYKTLYEQAIDSSSKSYVGGFDKFRNYSHPYGPQNKDIVTPNNDTPYSWAWLDLRREPWVLTVPAVPKDRYYVFQWIDLYTYNFAYVGSRATGNGAGHYLFVGPSWHGDTPKGIDKVFHSETDLILTLGRTALNGASDVKNVEAIQKQYKLTPLSAFEHTAAPPPVAKLDFPKWDEAKATSVDFIAYLNFMLQFTQPPAPSEKDLMARFATIGIAPGAPFDPAALPPETRAALEAGVADGKAALADAEKHTTGSFNLFGSRADLKDDYTKRAVAAAMGIYGNTKEEAVYVGTRVNGEHVQLVGSQPYVLHFDKKGPAAREVLLVDDAVRPACAPSGRQSDQPLLDRRSHERPEVRRRRLAGYLRAEHVTGCGQGFELAAGAHRGVRPRDADLWPGSDRTRRQLEIPRTPKALSGEWTTKKKI